MVAVAMAMAVAGLGAGGRADALNAQIHPPGRDQERDESEHNTGHLTSPA